MENCRQGEIRGCDECGGRIGGSVKSLVQLLRVCLHEGSGHTVDGNVNG